MFDVRLTKFENCQKYLDEKNQFQMQNALIFISYMIANFLFGLSTKYGL